MGVDRAENRRVEQLGDMEGHALKAEHLAGEGGGECRVGCLGGKVVQAGDRGVERIAAYIAQTARQAERLRLESSENSVLIAKSALYPSISLSGGYGTGVYSADSDKFWAQMRHNSREYAGVPLDNPIFNRRAARNDISKAQLAVRSQQLAVTQTVQAKYEFVFRRRFPISTAGSRCNSENGRF